MEMNRSRLAVIVERREMTDSEDDDLASLPEKKSDRLYELDKFEVNPASASSSSSPPSSPLAVHRRYGSFA